MIHETSFECLLIDGIPTYEHIRDVRFTTNKGKVRRLNGIIMSRGKRHFPIWVFTRTFS